MSWYLGALRAGGDWGGNGKKGRKETHPTPLQCEGGGDRSPRAGGVMAALKAEGELADVKSA